MILGPAPTAYDPKDQTELRAALRRADGENLKKGRDIRFGSGFGRLIFVDTDGTQYELTAPAGVTTWTALP